jgi:hypothetical protein
MNRVSVTIVLLGIWVFLMPLLVLGCRWLYYHRRGISVSFTEKLPKVVEVPLILSWSLGGMAIFLSLFF